MVFDVGETLVCEDRAWADWLGVSPAVLAAALGSTIVNRTDHKGAFRMIRPGMDVERERIAKRGRRPTGGPSRNRIYTPTPSPV